MSSRTSTRLLICFSSHYPILWISLRALTAFKVSHLEKQSLDGNLTKGLNKSGRPHVFNQDPEINASPVVLFQTAELAEHTSKITLLEEARKRKEEEATTWQLKVRPNGSVELKEGGFCFLLIS